MSWEDVGRALIGVLVVLIPTLWWINRNMMPRNEIHQEIEAINGRLQDFERRLSDVARDVAYIRGKLEGGNG